MSNNSNNNKAPDVVPYIGIRKEVAVIAIILLLIVFFIIYFASTIKWGKPQTAKTERMKIIKKQVISQANNQNSRTIMRSLLKKPKVKHNVFKAPVPARLLKSGGTVPGIPVKKAFNPNSANNSPIQVIAPPSALSGIKKAMSGGIQPNNDIAFQAKLLKQLQLHGNKKSENQKHISFLGKEKKTALASTWFSPYGEFNTGTKYFIAPGSIIPATLETGVNSQLPGQVVAIVNQNVYSHDLTYLLIPRGAELIGQYDTSVGATQTRVLLAFSLIIFPNGTELQLPGFEGNSHRGYAGLHDVVDYHFWSTAKSVSLLTLVDFGIQEAAGNTTGNMYPTPAQNFATSLSQNLGNVAQQIINKQISLAPTLKVEPGFTFDIVVTKNILFKVPYR